MQPETTAGVTLHRPTMVMLSHLRWDFVFQRPHHIATRAASDFDVIYIEEPLRDGQSFTLRQETREKGVQLIQPIVPTDAAPEQVLDHQKLILQAVQQATEDGIDVLWYYTPMALPFARQVEAKAIVFDKMDELSAFAFAADELRQQERELLDCADLVLAGGASLYHALSGKHSNLHLFPSSVDAFHFGSARLPVSEPVDLIPIARPRIGFFGVIDERMDYQLVADFSAARPDWQIVMIGPFAKVDPSALPQADNIHWLGAKPYADLPAYLAYLDIGWMPFALNRATRFISPTKTPEFLAAGLPVISTPVRDVVNPFGHAGLVKIAGGVADHLASAEEVLRESGNPKKRRERLSAVDRYLTGNSWDNTWAKISRLLQSVLSSERRQEVEAQKEKQLV